ncbi:hypothetical protein [Rothia halotolerans]|uniref:hypothetical protein n=1 Tax=Rothia halotolerans TaxID=405770 RepID=UPI00101BE64D|nr:hypothetical protein [Rothia halotolerans]
MRHPHETPQDRSGAQAPRPSRKARRGEQPPRSWWADLRLFTLCAVGIVVGTTGLLLLASTGLMRHETSHIPIHADATWAGVLASIGAIMWAFFPISSSRPGFGYRHQGLPGLLVLGALIAAGIDLLAMLAWPLIVGDRTAPDSVLATLASDPASAASLALFLIAMHALSALVVLGFLRGGLVSSLVVTGLFLVLIGVGAWQGVRLFERSPDGSVLLTWGVAAVVALAAVATVSAIAGPKEGRRR